MQKLKYSKGHYACESGKKILHKIVSLTERQPPWMNVFISRKIIWKNEKSVLKMGQLKMTLNLGKQYLVSCLTKTQKPDYHNHLAKKLCCSKTSAKRI